MVSRILNTLKALPDLPGETISEVKGFGKSRDADASEPVVEDEIEYSKKVKLEIVVPESRVGEVPSAIWGCV
jgi:nitrogen regulatory protein PII